MYEIRTSKKLKVPAADLATQIWEACKRTLAIFIRTLVLLIDVFFSVLLTECKSTRFILFIPSILS